MARESDRVIPGTLLFYESDGAVHWVLMAKSGGGFRTTLGEGAARATPVQILSTTLPPPPGSELLGLRVGETVEVEIRRSVKELSLRSLE